MKVAIAKSFVAERRSIFAGHTLIQQRKSDRGLAALAVITRHLVCNYREI